MTKITRRTEIQIETHDILIIRRGGRKSTVYCERCNKEIDASDQVSTVNRLIEAGVDRPMDIDHNAPLCGHLL